MDDVLELAEQVADESWATIPCSHCGESKLREEYYPNGGRGGARKRHCRECASAKMAARPTWEPATDGYQPCSKCGEVKHATEFSIHRYSRPENGLLAGRERRCKSCCRNQHRVRRYGVSPQRFEEMLAEQGGVCGICETDDWGPHGPNLDHDHETGEPRGILCWGCNTMLGAAGDNPATLRRAAAYIEEHDGRP